MKKSFHFRTFPPETVTRTAIKHMTENKKKRKDTPRVIKDLLVKTALKLVGSGVTVYFNIPSFSELKV